MFTCPNCIDHGTWIDPCAKCKAKERTLLDEAIERATKRLAELDAAEKPTQRK